MEYGGGSFFLIMQIETHVEFLDDWFEQYYEPSCLQKYTWWPLPSNPISKSKPNPSASGPSLNLFTISFQFQI